MVRIGGEVGVDGRSYWKLHIVIMKRYAGCAGEQA
jgi:hypothetical protein